MFFMIEDWQLGKMYNTEAEVMAAVKEDYNGYRRCTYVIAEAKQAVRPVTPEVNYEQIPIENVNKKDCGCEEVGHEPTISAQGNT